MKQTEQTAPLTLPAEGGALPVDAGDGPDATPDAAALAHAAAAQGVALATADCDRARSRSAVLRAIARAVDAAEYFGGDLDRLFDCLCDAIAEQKTGVILWLQNLHSGDPDLTADAARIEAVCQDASEHARRHGKTFHYLITHAGRHADPEPGHVTPWSAAGK